MEKKKKREKRYFSTYPYMSSLCLFGVALITGFVILGLTVYDCSWKVSIIMEASWIVVMIFCMWANKVGYFTAVENGIYIRAILRKNRLITYEEYPYFGIGKGGSNPQQRDFIFFSKVPLNRFDQEKLLDLKQPILKQTCLIQYTDESFAHIRQHAPTPAIAAYWDSAHYKYINS